MARTKTLSIHPCDDTAQVVTIERTGATTFPYRRKPCEECPWLKSNKKGAFPVEAFRHSAKTAYDMAQSKFSCHMAGREKLATCAGFLLSGAQHNLSVRMAAMSGLYDPASVKGRRLVYPSYRAMAIANGVAADDPCLAPCRDPISDRKRLARRDT